MRDDMVPALDTHLDAFRAREFKYGESDCMIFVLGWLKIATGNDHLGDLKWGSLKEGQEIMKARGLGDWAGAMDSILEKRHPIRARGGDIVAHKEDNALGICLGARCVWLAPDIGLRFGSLGECSLAWGVEPCLS